MKDQPRDLNQTWPVGRKWSRFTNAPKILGFLPLGAQDIKFLTTFCDFRTPHPSLERNVASTNKNASVKLQCHSVFLKRWPIFYDLWPRNYWDTFRHLEPPYRRPLHSMRSVEYIIRRFDIISRRTAISWCNWFAFSCVQMLAWSCKKNILSLSERNFWWNMAKCIRRGCFATYN